MKRLTVLAAVFCVTGALAGPGKAQQVVYPIIAAPPYQSATTDADGACSDSTGFPLCTETALVNLSDGAINVRSKVSTTGIVEESGTALAAGHITHGIAIPGRADEAFIVNVIVSLLSGNSQTYPYSFDRIGLDLVDSSELVVWARVSSPYGTATSEVPYVGPGPGYLIGGQGFQFIVTPSPTMRVRDVKIDAGIRATSILGPGRIPREVQSTGGIRIEQIIVRPHP